MIKSIPNFPKYFASDDGEIYSCKRGSIVRLKGSRARNHRTVALIKCGVEFREYIHRLILETFVGPCPVGMECRHLDGNPLNNNLSNLKWGTHKENMEDRRKHGTAVLPDQKGEKHSRSFLTEINIRDIRRRCQCESDSQIARAFNISREHVRDIRLKRRWKHVQ